MLVSGVQQSDSATDTHTHTQTHHKYFSNAFPLWVIRQSLGFPSSSAGKESTCKEGDPGLIPGSGRTPGERVGYPLQNSLDYLITQMVKNPSAIRETWVGSLG